MVGEGKMPMAQDLFSLYAVDKKVEDHHHWEIMDGEEDDHHTHNDKSSTPSIEDSTVSNGSSASSSSSLEMADDASSSSTSCSSSSSSTGALYDLSELMAQLPIKRGLSKFYEGKSQSFTSLSRVKSVEDLPKKGNIPYKRKMKASKSYAGGLDTYKLRTLPKPVISKKLTPSRRGSFVISNCRTPLIPVQENLGC